jgi:predicted TIM-barrel fold metal-dependent hydrolase
MTVVDSQVHIWGNDGRKPDPSIAHRAGISPSGAELLAEMDAAGVDRAVLVPPGFADSGTGFTLGLARQHPDRFAVMATLPVQAVPPPEVLPWLEFPEVLGFRLNFGRGPAVRWLADRTADWFWALAAEAAAPVMVYTPGNVAALVPVLERHQNLRLIIDHAGLPSSPPPLPMEEIVAQALPLARFPNVAVKASALPCATSEPFPFPAAQRCVRLLVGAFGPERVFWGSDLTRLPCPYPEAVCYLAEPGGLTADELPLVMGRGLEAFLGWEHSA